MPRCARGPRTWYVLSMSVFPATALAPAEMSFAEWASMPEDEPGELVDGRLVEEEAPDLYHETFVAWFVFTLKLWLAGRGGFVFGSEGKLGVAPRRGRKPDVTAYLPGSKKPPARGIVQTPPDIAIEVVSPTPRDGRRDRIEKAGEYAAFGVRWYWIVDPALRTLEIFELGADGRYVRALGETVGRIEIVPGCAGLTLDLDAMWAEADRLEATEE
jgi:Uma2 family endonuclease